MVVLGAVEVGVHQRAVRVPVLVHEVHREQQVEVAEDPGGRALGDDAVVLGEDDAAVGQHLEPVEVVGREHDRLPGRAELDDELDEPLLGAGVEGRGRLVEEQHFGVHDEDRRDRDPLLLPARQLVRRAVGELDDVEHRERVVDARVDLVAGQAHVQRAERDLLPHRRREHLRVGVLEHETDPRAEPARELLVFEVVLGDVVRRTRGSEPVSGNTSPSSTFSSVDLPQPFAPRSATFSPRRTVSDTSSSAGNRSRYAYDASSTASSVAVPDTVRSTSDDTVQPECEDGGRRARGHECDVEDADAERRRRCARRP